MRVAIFVHGRGRGHATRSEELQDYLHSKGMEAHLLAGGRAFEVLAGRPLLHQSDVLLPGVSNLANLPSFVARARDKLQELEVSAVVSDGSAAGVLAARQLRLPVIAVGHDVVFQLRPPRQHSRWSLWKQRTNAWHLHFADAWVGAHFLDEPSSPPHTPSDRRWVEIGRPLLSGLDPALCSDNGQLAVYLRDRAMLPALAPLSQVHLPQVFFGPKEWTPPWMEAGGSDRSVFLRFLHEARAVVGSAGSNLISECIALCKPMLLLHQSSEAEQSLNAAWVAARGLGMAVRLERFGPRDCDEWLERVSNGRFAKFDLLGSLSPVVQLVADRLVSLG